MERTWRPPWRRLAWPLLAGVLALSAWGWSRVRFVSSLEMLLADGSEARRIVGLLREADFADKVVLRFVATDGEGVANASSTGLVESMDRVVSRLDRRMVLRVIVPPPEGQMVAEMLFWLDYAGELLAPEDLADLEAMTSPEALRRRLRQCYLELLKPGGELFMGRVIPHDPLGIGMRILRRAYELSQAMGFRAVMAQGHFLHADGGEGVLLLETAVPMTDIAGSRELVAGLEALRPELAPGIRMDILCGHLHTVHNDRALRRDILVAATVATLALLALFLGWFRDLRAGAVFLIPGVAIVVAIGLCALATSGLATMVVGMAGAMAGIAVDYGLHVYVAIRSRPDRWVAVREVARPVTLGALTTMGVFVAFLFSGVPAYRQLGAMATATLLLSLLASLWLLPAVMRTVPRASVRPRCSLRRWGERTWILALVACLLPVAAALLSMGARLDPDLASLDATPSEVLAAEADFLARWGRGESGLAIAVTPGRTQEEAASAADALYRAARQALPEGEPLSLSAIWPSAATRGQRLAAWRAFWDPARVARLRTDLAAAGEAFGFAEDAFAPFFAALAEEREAMAETPGALVASMASRFVRGRPGDWRYFTYFPDTPGNVQAMRALADHGGGGVISRHAVGQALAESTLVDGRRIGLISVVLIVLATLLLTRPLRHLPAVVLPALAAGVAVLFLTVHSSLSLNAASVIAVIVVLGLGIDYGAMTVHAWARDGAVGLGQATASISLSAVTTMIGALSLAPARHPALRHVGFTLLVGVGVAYLCSLLIVPGLCCALDRLARRLAGSPPGDGQGQASATADGEGAPCR